MGRVTNNASDEVVASNLTNLLAVVTALKSQVNSLTSAFARHSHGSGTSYNDHLTIINTSSNVVTYGTLSSTFVSNTVPSFLLNDFQI